MIFKPTGSGTRLHKAIEAAQSESDFRSAANMQRKSEEMFILGGAAFGGFLTSAAFFFFNDNPLPAFFSIAAGILLGAWLIHDGKLKRSIALSRLAGIEAEYWKIAATLARSESELASIGWPVRYKCCWIEAELDDQTGRRIYGIREAKPEEPRPEILRYGESFEEAKSLINEMIEEGDLINQEETQRLEHID